MTGILYPVLVFGGLAAFVWMTLTLQHRMWESARPRTLKARPLRQVLEDSARPGFRLARSHGPGFSRFGGEPHLPALSWPAVEGRPMRFVARIELSRVSGPDGIDWLPSEGALHVFYDPEHLDEHAVRVLFAPNIETGVSDGDQARARPPGMAFRRVRCVPSLDWLGLNDGFAEGFRPDPELVRPGPRHLIGGYPEELQQEQMAVSCERLSRGEPLGRGLSHSPAEVERVSAIWRLLFQLDSDRDLGLELAGGRLFVFIRECDARSRDFSKTVTIWQPS